MLLDLDDIILQKKFSCMVSGHNPDYGYWTPSADFLIPWLLNQSDLWNLTIC